MHARRRFGASLAVSGPRSFRRRKVSCVAHGHVASTLAAKSWPTSGNQEGRPAMSRIGKMPIPVPKSVTVDLADGSVRVKGPKGELARQVPREISIVRDDGELRVERSSD